MEVIKNGARAWVTQTREILSLKMGTIITPQKVGSRFHGKFKELSKGSLIMGTLSDGTQVEVMKVYLS
jgi:hypothetical protein